MKAATWFLRVAAIVIAVVSPGRADEWSWRRIAWEGDWMSDVVSPPDSSAVIYASLPFSYGGVYKSYDGGWTWRFLPGTYNPVSARLTIDPKDPATVYCGGETSVYDPDGHPRWSRDAGAHWEMVPWPADRIVPSPWTQGLLMATESIQGGWSLWRSTDDGLTWTAISGSETPGMTDKVIFHAEDSLVVFAGYVGFDSQGLARSLDEGETWDVALEGVINSFDQDPSNGAHLVAVEEYDDYTDEPAYFAESWDHGVTWELWPLPDPILGVRELVFDRFDSQILYMADFYFESLGVYRSLDGGHTWEPMNNGFDPLPSRCRPYPRESPPGELFAATRSGLWLWSNAQHADGRPEVLERSLRIVAAAPNPFRDDVGIRFTSNSGARSDAMVYSLDGALIRILATRASAPGMREVRWDGRRGNTSPVPPGTYVLRIRAGDETAALKVVRLE